MLDLPKYPRTLHLGASGGGTSKHSAPLTAVRGAHLVIEEKVDGSHAGLCFDDDANLLLFHRSAVVPVGDSEFRLLREEAERHLDSLWDALGTRYIMYGEWAYLTHTIAYDALSAFFLEDDIYDRERGAFLSTEARARVLSNVPRRSFPPVRVLATGRFEEIVKEHGELASLAGPSGYCEQFGDAVAMEGLYIKHEEGDVVRARYKWVRPEFLAQIADAEKHWRARSPQKNRLRR